MPKTAARKRDSLGKSLQLLWWIVDSSDDTQVREWGVRELGEALHLPPASVHRLLTLLRDYGLVHRNPDTAQYQVGLEFYRLALKLASRFGLRNVGVPVLQDLIAKCNETVFLGRYDPFRKEMMFVAVIHSDHPVRCMVPINEWVPVYAGASGMAIMAFLPKEERQAIIERTRLVPLTGNTITDPVALEEELSRVRVRGYAFSRGHRNPGVVAVAAPIWGPDARVMAELAVTMPESRFDRSMEPGLARMVIDHANRITEKIGGRKAGFEPRGLAAPRHRNLRDRGSR